MTFAQSVILSPLTRLYQLLSHSLSVSLCLRISFVSTSPHLVAAPISWWVWLMTAIMSQSVARLLSMRGAWGEAVWVHLCKCYTHSRLAGEGRWLKMDGWMGTYEYTKQIGYANDLLKSDFDEKRATQSQDEYLELTAIKVTWTAIEMCKKLYNQSLPDITWRPPSLTIELKLHLHQQLVAPTTSKLGACHTPVPATHLHITLFAVDNR